MTLAPARLGILAASLEGRRASPMLHTLRVLSLAVAALTAPALAQPTPYATGLTDPYGLIQLADGRVLVTEYLAGRVSVISDAAGTALPSPQPFIGGLVSPAGLVQLADGRVLVADSGGGVSVISDTGAAPLPSPQPFVASLKAALGLCRLADDRVLVTESFRGRVAIISDGGGAPRVNPRTFVNQMQDPEGIVQLADGRVLASEYNGGRVSVLSDTNADPLAQAEPYVGGLDAPSGLVQLTDGRVLVADIEAGRVAVLSDAQGHPLAEAEDYATGLAQPAGLLQLADGRVLVAEGDAGRVTVIGGGAGGVPVAFATASLSAPETAGTVEFVVRVDGTPSAGAAVTVTRTSGDAADLGGFTAASVAVAGPGTYPVSVPITDDDAPEDDESFRFTLTVTNAPGAAAPLVVASPSTATLVVTDDDLVTATVATDAGPFLFAAPVGGLTAGDVAAAGGGPVFTYDASADAFAEAAPDAPIARGQPLLVRATGAPLTLAGGPGPGVLRFETDVDAAGHVRALVGNPTDHPIALSAVEVAGGAVTDVVLVFADGAFRPVSLAGLAASGPRVLRPHEAAVLRIAPAEAPADVAVTLDASVGPTDGAPLAEAAFVPTDGETAVLLALTGGPGIRDAVALRFGTEDAELDAADVASPLGVSLAARAPAGPPAAPFAARAFGPLGTGEVAVPLTVAVPGPGPGAYEIALTADPGRVGGLSVLVFLTDTADGTGSYPLDVGAPYAFEVGEGDDVTGRFTVRVALGVTPSVEGGVPGAEIDVWPNPSTGAVAVRLAAPASDRVRVAVYDALGREVAVLHDGPTAGEVRAAVPTGTLSPGVYVVRASGRGLALTRRLTVAR